MARTRGRPTEQESLRIAREPLLEELMTACAASHAALSLPTADRNRQLEDSFFRVAAALEGFFTDWFIRCLSFDMSRLEATYEQRAANQAVADLGRWEPSQRLWRRKQRAPPLHVTIPIERRVSQAEAARYLGWGEGTKSFKDTRELESLAAELLAPRFANRIAALSNARKRIIDATTATRNVLAHRSPRGVTEMNRCLVAGGLPAVLRRPGNQVTARGIGNYLRADAGGRPRFQVYIEEVAAIAYELAPGGAVVQVCP